MYKDLREWLTDIERMGELLRVREEVDWDEELSALTFMIAKEEGAPAILFEKTKGYSEEYRVLQNFTGSSLRRVAYSLGLAPDLSLTETISSVKDLFKTRVPPVEVPPEVAPVNENIHLGDEADVLEFPAPKMWPLDGGRYIGTGDVVITQDPDTGQVNLGVYRQMVHSAREVGFYISPGKDGLLHRQNWWKRGEPCPVAVAYGIDPLLFAVGSQGFAKNVSEYEFAGGIRGEPVEVTRGGVTGLPIPAQAEIVIEGYAYPGASRPEGPFGEFTGYYGRPEAETPVIDVKAVRHRHNPILTCALMAEHPAKEGGLMMAVCRSAKIWDDLDKLGIPGIRGVYSYPSAAGFGVVCVSVDQKHPGHAQQVLAIAAQSPAAAYYTKWIIAVDGDVDPTDFHQVLWAMSTRCDPAADVDILRNTWSTYLDPTKNPPEDRPYGSKALINACMEHKHMDVFSRRTKMRRSVYDRLVERWPTLGIKLDPPVFRVFEE